MAGKIYVTKPVFPEAIEFLQKNFTVEMNPDERVLTREELLGHLRRSDGALTQLTDIINREVLEALPGLKIISNIAVGFNNIDTVAATELGIPATNTPGVLTETTADFAWTLMMAAARRVVEGDAFARSGQWKAWGLQMLLGHDVHGKTIGIVGFGRIGQAMARRARGFGMKIQCFDTLPIDSRVAEETGAVAVSLETLLSTADFVTLHVPLLPETTHLLSDKAFSTMKPNCIVINTARGPVIDEKALVRALKDGKIAGAGLDVFEREPEIDPELLQFENVVLAPHISSASRETRLRMCMMAAENIAAGLGGQKPPNLVNPEVWEKRRR